MLMHVTTGLFLRVIDKLMHIARHRPIAAGRVRGEPTARVHRKVRGLLHRCTVQSWVAWMTTAPWRPTQAIDGRPVFVARPSTGLARLAAPRARRPNAFFPPCGACPFWPAV